MSFVVFQVLDLQDSISAQAASILILFSLCFKAAGTASWQRIIGTLIGCNAALSFVVFQVLDLQDSISAQAASILILFSLCFKAAGTASWQRIIGTFIVIHFKIGHITMREKRNKVIAI